MPRIYDLADVVRSKNAGPFQITIDLMFADMARYQRVQAAGVLVPEVLGPLYGVAPEAVSVIAFERVRAIKITVPRTMGSHGSGSAFDNDVYGAQQHGPVAQLQIP